jgi:hypothetical protein
MVVNSASGLNQERSRRTVCRSSPAARVGVDDAVAQSQQADAAQQVMQRGQRRQVVFELRRPIQQMPVRSLLLHLADDRAGQPATRGQSYAAVGQVEHQPDAFRHRSHRLPDQQVRGRLVEVGQPIAHPRAQVLVLVVVRVGEHVEQLGVPARPAAVLRRAGALAVHAARLGAASPEQLNVVLPVIAEVIDIAEPGWQVRESHGSLVALVVEVVHVRHAITQPAGDELVQMAVGPAQRHPQHVVQLGSVADDGTSTTRTTAGTVSRIVIRSRQVLTAATLRTRPGVA